MPEWLFARSTVITLALIGAAFSLLGSWSNSKGWVSKQQLHWMNRAAYIFMGASMVLFVFAGLLGAGAKPG